MSWLSCVACTSMRTFDTPDLNENVSSVACAFNRDTKSGMRNIVVGTAGHIDHGKTTLVRALTGIDTDRLQEEKRRGISIDLGFAHLRLSENLRAAFIDVPGHERFIKNML